MKKLTLTVLFLILAHISSIAQKENFFGLSTDAFALSQGGYGIEGNYFFSKYRFSISLFDYSLPEFYNSQSDNFEVKRKFYEIGISKRFVKDRSALSVGLSAGNYYSANVTQQSTGISLEKAFWKAGFRCGFMWFPVEKLNLYLEPAFSVGLAINDKRVVYTTDPDIYEKNTWQFTAPQILFGWKFDL